jgi:pilus assembly protein CpaE
VPGHSILLLETDPAAGETIRSALARAAYTVATVLDVAAAEAAAGEHQLIIVDVVAPPSSGPDACRELRAVPAMSSMPVLCISQSDDVEERIKFLEAGADDVIARPFDARELEARLEALLLRFQRSRDIAPVNVDGAQQRRGRRVIAVFSPKGGVGTTTIAVNVATLANQLHPERTILVDLDLQFGQVATHLNIQLNHSMADLARDEEALRDLELLRTYVSQEENGVAVIGAPGSPELAQLVQARHVERLLQTLVTGYDVIVVDAGSQLDERTLAIFEQAECVVIPLIAEIGALKAIHTTIDYLSETGSVLNKTMLVLNNMFPKEPLKVSDVENALGMKVSMDLPYDALLYVKAVNEGVPVITGAPKSQAADRLSRLAGAALAGESTATQTVVEERRRGLGGLLRRGA